MIGTMKEVRTWELDGTPLNELWVISSTAFAIVPEAHARLSNEWSQDPDSSRVFKEIYDWQGFVTVERYTRSVPTDADDQHLGHLSRLEAR